MGPVPSNRGWELVDLYQWEVFCHFSLRPEATSVEQREKKAARGSASDGTARRPPDLYRSRSSGRKIPVRTDGDVVPAGRRMGTLLIGDQGATGSNGRGGDNGINERRRQVGEGKSLYWSDRTKTGQSPFWEWLSYLVPTGFEQLGWARPRPLTLSACHGSTRAGA